MTKKPITLVQQDYQPTKAETEEATVLRKKDGSVPTPTEVMRALTRPVEITYLEKPRHVTRESSSTGRGTFLYNSLSF